MRLALVLLALWGQQEAVAFMPRLGPLFGRVLQPGQANSLGRGQVARLAAVPALRTARSLGTCVMQMTDVKPGLAEPSEETIKQALSNAEEVVKAAGGCIDSLSFGREWKEMYPTFDRDAFKGTRITSFNKLLSMYGSELFSIESTKKKEVKLYILKDSAGAEGKVAYQKAEQQLQELADSPLGVFFDIRGGRMRAGGARALPPNLSSYTKLDQLLDALEPNLVAFAGGVSVVSAKDAVTALNNIKRLNYQARWPVQQSRAESFVQVFVDIATRGISTLSTKSIALLLNAIEALSSDRRGFEKTLQAASMRIQTLAKGIEILLPVVGDDADEIFTPQAVAVIVTAYQRMGLMDKALFTALAGVVKTLPAQDFDAQALSNIANAYSMFEGRDDDMFAQLALTSSTLTADSWNPTALSLFASALVKVGMSESEGDKALLHQLAEMQCAMYASQGARAFSSPANLAQTLSALATAKVQHVRLFTCAAVVVAQHFRLCVGQQAQSGNLLMPQDMNSANKGGKKMANRQDATLLAAKRFMEQATGLDLALIAGALSDAGALQPDLASDMLGHIRRSGLPAGNTEALAAVIRAFGPAASIGAKDSAEVHEFLSLSFSVLPSAALTSVEPIKRVLRAMEEAEWKDGASVTKLTQAICQLKSAQFKPNDRSELEGSMAGLNMPRHLSPAIAHLMTMP